MNSSIKKNNTQYGPNCIGNVIRIIDGRTLIVNIGASRLRLDDIIQVFALGEPLYDIDGNILCHYEHIKDTLKVIRVEEKYSVCQKQDSKTTNLMLPLSPLFETVQFVPLKVNECDIKPFAPVNLKVQLGDPIKLANN